jgi:sec-independent protein translocase protein TatB
MFGLGTTEIIIILLIALVVFGPSEIPKVAKSLGKGMATLRKATDELKETVEEDKDLKMIKDSFQEAADTIRGKLDYEEMFDKVFPEDDPKNKELDTEVELIDHDDAEVSYDDIFPDGQPGEPVGAQAEPKKGAAEAKTGDKQS